MSDRQDQPGTTATIRRLAGTEQAGISSRVRINIARTATKGYTADTTVEVAWSGNEIDEDERATNRLAQLLTLAGHVARDEIALRERKDGASA